MGQPLPTTGTSALLLMAWVGVRTGGHVKPLREGSCGHLILTLSQRASQDSREGEMVPTGFQTLFPTHPLWHKHPGVVLGHGAI